MILAWFWSMGVTVNEIENWINNPRTHPIDIMDVLSEYEEELKKKLQKKIWTKQITLPLPHLSNVKVRLPSVILQLMNDSQEDKLFTEHVCPHPPLFQSKFITNLYSKVLFQFPSSCWR
jgi:hypothetical protein